MYWLVCGAVNLGIEFDFQITQWNRPGSIDAVKKIELAFRLALSQTFAQVRWAQVTHSVDEGSSKKCYGCQKTSFGQRSA